jgi:DNA excision repair protein ERCC-2
MGGIFGEGIDLVGERLVGAAIVGVGLPGLSPERELIRAYFERRERAGLPLPTSSRASTGCSRPQGRVIRTGRDTGIVLLIDRRFATKGYAIAAAAHLEAAAIDQPATDWR